MDIAFDLRKIRMINLNLLIARKPFSRGEGAPKGRMRNAGNALKFSTMSVPIVVYNTGIGL